MRAVICHGTKGSPAGNWFPWLRDSLETRGLETYVPAFPTPENQSKQAWLAAFDATVPQMNSETILIGHSCGATFLLHVLGRLEIPVYKTLFISPVMDFIGNAEYDALNQTFFPHKTDWEKVAAHAGTAHVLHGDNDPYVPVAQARNLAGKLKVPLELISGGGHLNSESGYTAFPRLLTHIVG